MMKILNNSSVIVFLAKNEHLMRLAVSIQYYLIFFIYTSGYGVDLKLIFVFLFRDIFKKKISISIKNTCLNDFDNP